MSSTSGFEQKRPDIFELLSEIRARPGMFLGYTDRDGRERMVVLEALLNGYEIALHQLGYDDINSNFFRALGNFLQPKLGYGNEIGPVAAALEHAGPERALEQFWQFVDEFRATLPAGK